MAIRRCEHCAGSERLCVACGKAAHVNKETSSYDSCKRQLRRVRVINRSKHCEKHQPTLAVCDMCGATAPPVKKGRYPNRYDDIPDGWQEVRGLRPGESAFKGIECCPSCYGTVRVGFDWSLERAGEPLLSESIACAFAFQLGQVTADLARSGAGGSHWWATFVWEHLGPDYRPTAEARLVPCRDQAPNGARCSLPTGHNGPHRGGADIWGAAA